MERLFVFFMFVMCCLSQYAQDGLFDKCYNWGGNAEKADVYIQKPDGFHSVYENGADVLVVNKNYKPADALYEGERVIALHPVALESDNKECVLLYPVISPTIPMLHGTPERELHAALGDENKDVSGSVRKIKLEDMSRYGNADVVYVYDMKLPESYLGRYSNCVGLYLRKYAHPALLMKVVMTDEGLSRRDDYIQKLLGSVRYGDAVSADGVKMESVAHDDSLRIVNHIRCRHVQDAQNKSAK